MRIFLLALLAVLLSTSSPAQTVPDSTQRRGRWFVLPILYYTPETKLGFGARLAYTFRQRSNDRPSILPITAIYTTNKQTILGFAPDLWLNGNANHLYGQVGYLDYPFKFYGIGNNTSEAFEEPYTTRIFDAYAGYERRVARALYLGIRVEAREENIVKTEPGRLLSSGALRGSTGQSVLGAGLTLTNDSRDDVFYPTRGFYNQFTVITYRNSHKEVPLPPGFFQNTSPSTFLKFRLDLRRYQPLGKGVLALNALGIFTGGQPTFQYLSLIGGEKIMRGYFEGRYRDRNLAVLQAEYRFPISSRFKVVAFAHTGRVWQGNDISLKQLQLHAAGGAGLRYRVGKDNLHLRFDLAYGQALYPYFAFTEAF